MSINFADYLTISLFALFIIGSGQYFSRNVRGTKDYFAAGGVMPWWLCGISFTMAAKTAFIFVTYNEIAYLYGITGILIYWMVPPAMLIGGYFLAHRWRRARILTPLEFTERRYNGKVHQLLMWAGLPLRLLDNGLRILTTGIFITAIMRHSGISLLQCLILLGSVMIIYSFLGGQLVVMITDSVLAVIILVATSMLFVLSIKAMGNVSGFIAQAPPGFFKAFKPPYDWTYGIFTMFALSLLSLSTSWSLVQKYNAVRSEKDARRMVYLVALVTTVTPVIYFFPGIVARVILPGIANAKEVYGVMSLHLLPNGLIGLILVAMLSATMAAMGSEYNSISGIFTVGLFRKHLASRVSEKNELRFARLATVVIGLSTLVLAIMFNFLKGLTLLDIMIRFTSALCPPLMIPVVTGLLWKKINARGVVWGVIVGVITGTILVTVNLILTQIYGDAMKIDPRIDFWLRSGWTSVTTVINIFVTLLALWFGSIQRPTPTDEAQRSKAFFADLERPFEMAVKSGRPALSPMHTVGNAILVFGFLYAVTPIYLLLFTTDRRAFRLNLIAALAIIVSGFLLRIAARRR